MTNPILSELYRIDPPFLLEKSESDKSIIPLIRHFSWAKHVSKVMRDIDALMHAVGQLCSGGGDLMFANISEFAKNFLCLPHSSAEVERVFSAYNLIKTKLRNQLDITTCESVLLAKSLLKMTDKCCYKFENIAQPRLFSEILDHNQNDDQHQDIVNNNLDLILFAL